jgi:hypothetical protein
VDHPFAGWLEHRALWLTVCWVATLALMTILAVQGAPLRTGAATRGVVSFELPWTAERAAEVKRAWEEGPGDLVARAKRQIGIDFAFLLVYPLALSLAGARLSESPHDGPTLVGAPVGVFIAWAVLLAGPLDLVENLAMLRMLGAGVSGGLARLASWCAAVKFTLVFAALGYVVLQGLAVLGGRLRG